MRWAILSYSFGKLYTNFLKLKCNNNLVDNIKSYRKLCRREWVRKEHWHTRKLLHCKISGWVMTPPLPPAPSHTHTFLRVIRYAPISRRFEKFHCNKSLPFLEADVKYFFPTITYHFSMVTSERYWLSLVTLLLMWIGRKSLRTICGGIIFIVFWAHVLSVIFLVVRKIWNPYTRLRIVYFLNF